MDEKAKEWGVVREAMMTKVEGDKGRSELDQQSFHNFSAPHCTIQSMETILTSIDALSRCICFVLVEDQQMDGEDWEDNRALPPLGRRRERTSYTHHPPSVPNRHIDQNTAHRRHYPTRASETAGIVHPIAVN